MSASEIDRTLVRLAHEILEKTEDLTRWPSSASAAAAFRWPSGWPRRSRTWRTSTIPVGILDINLYRDDLSTVSEKPVHNATEITFPVTGKDVILMDDVLYTGRTIRAALDALFDHGRPARVQLLVLIDRGHRELPIEARYVGRMVQTTANEIIEVKFQEIDQNWRRFCWWRRRRSENAGWTAWNRSRWIAPRSKRFSTAPKRFQPQPNRLQQVRSCCAAA